MTTPILSLRPFRVAVASSDGTTVDLHLGRTRTFLVFAWINAAWTREKDFYLEGEGGGEAFAAQVGKFTPFRVVLAAQAGPHAIRPLAAQGIEVLTVQTDIDQALKKISQAVLFRKELFPFPPTPQSLEKNGFSKN